MADDPIILGIDLGTTFSAMAYVDRHGKPCVLPNAEGHATTPSVIHFYDRDACVVGEEAVKMVVVDSPNVVRFVKRSMGEAGFSLDYFDHTYTPQELSALILKKLKADAEEALGFPVQDAVITVPAYFNSAQRGATSEAGALAGFNVLSILNEPTAAAIAYGVERIGMDRNLLVFDLGGGTFDVTVMEIRGTQFRTIATDGNAELGGKDWDDRLLNHVAEQFIRRFGADPRDDLTAYQELYERSLAAKIALSGKPRAAIPVNFQGHRTVVQVTREEFEGLTRDLVSQCADTCELVIERANMGWTDIHDVLLAGGSTRMPMIQAMIQERFGRPVVVGVNPDECVARGAALAAVFRHRPKHVAFETWRRNPTTAAPATPPPPAPPPPVERAVTPRGIVIALAEAGSAPQGAGPPLGLPQVQFTDVASHPLGIVVLDRNLQERVVPLIAAGTPLPCERRGRFAYAYDGMTAVRVEVTEGAGEVRDEVQVIGEVVLDELPPRPRGTPIEVIYRYTVNQMLEIDVTDLETRTSRRATIQLRGSLSGAELGAAQKRISSATVR